MKILCVHQGYELYGSDRSFLLNVRLLRDMYRPEELVVLLPKLGPLSEAFAAEGIPVDVADLWVPRRSKGALWLARRTLGFPAALRAAAAAARGKDLVYVNTSVVFDHILAARFGRAPTVLHLREIPTGPLRRVVRAVIAFSRGRVIFNSTATRDAFLPLPREMAFDVLPNAVPDRFGGLGVARRSEGDPFNLLMLGRINSWKGQDFLIEALAGLPERLRDSIKVRIVGASFENDPSEALARALAERLLPGRVTFHGFEPDPSESLAWAHAVVVPSRKPEPFGLVAIEAMSAARPVLAADHGGLAQIVEDHVGGRLFKPNDAESFRECLLDVMARAGSMGPAARERFLATYTVERYRDGLARILGEVVAPPPRVAPATVSRGDCPEPVLGREDVA